MEQRTRFIVVRLSDGEGCRIAYESVSFTSNIVVYRCLADEYCLGSKIIRNMFPNEVACQRAINDIYDEIERKK